VKFLADHAGEGVLPLAESHLSTDRYDVSWYVMPMAVPLSTAFGSDASIAAILDAVGMFAKALAHSPNKASATS